MKILILLFSFFVSSTVFAEEENQFVFESEPPVNCLEDYQEGLDNMDGYDVAKRDKECGGCFAAGINFGASLISLFYGGGDYKETIKIATLCGWDSDNPASTWGGLLGFMYGKKKIVELFKVEMSNSYNIHRTRINFQNNGMDNFNNMANKSVQIFEKVINEEFNGSLKNNKFVFDKKQSKYLNELEL